MVKMTETNNHHKAASGSPATSVTWWTVVKSVLRAIAIFINNLYCIPAYLLLMWVLRLTLRPRNPKLYWTIEALLFRWMLAQVSFWGWSAGYTVAETGDDISDTLKSECLVVVNHQSTGDVPTLFHSLQNKGTLVDTVLWVQDKIFQYSNFGWVSLVHKDFFIQQGKETRHLQGELLRKHLLDYYWPLDRKWIFIFPEGGFLRKRRLKSQEYGRKNGYPVLQHVTLPRIGAMQTVLNTISPQGIRQFGQQLPKDVHRRPLKWLVDITIGYPDQQAMDLQTIIGGWRKPCQTTLYFRKYPISEVPLETDELTQWLYARWEEKEHLLDEFYKTGKFPPKAGTNSAHGEAENNIPKVIQMNAKFIAVLHLIYLTLTWFEYRIISQVIGLLWSLVSLVF